MTDRIELFCNTHSRLTWGFQVNPSSCGNASHYENYIRLCAIGDQKRGCGTTHVFVRDHEGQRRILGFITLRASSFITAEADHLNGSPALEILELAVDKEFEGSGVGTELMKFTFATASMMNEETVGVQYIVLCADEQAVSYYKRFGFGCVEDHGEIPRDGWNVNCVPMFIKLPEIT